MKKALITTGLLLIAAVIFAQSSDVLVKERTIGKMLVTQEEIKAKEYIFPDRIYDSYIDTILESITVQLCGLSKNKKYLKKNGKILFYDLNDEKVKWSEDISYQTSNIRQFGSTIIVTAGDKSYRLNNENGADLWEVKNDIYFVDPVACVGIGYKSGSAKKYSNTLEGIDLETGKTKWKEELNREYGWNDAFRLKDSVWMIVTSGLHTVNAYDGTGWSYNTVTGDKDYSTTIATNAAGIALGVLTGTFMISTGYDVVRDIVSNVYFDSTGLYFASKEKISRINEDNGKIIWSYPFSAKLPSKSFLFTNDNYVFMINYGYAFMYARQIDYGTPFFAAFDKETGKQIFCTTLDKKNPIFGFKIKDDDLLLVLKDRIIKLSMSDGSKIFEKTMDDNKSGELEGFVGRHVYIDGANSTLTNLLLSDTSKNYIVTSKKIFICNEKFYVIGDIDRDQLYFAYKKIGDYKLVVKDNKTIVLDVDNKKVAELDITQKTTLIGNKLYSVQEKSFLEIDLTDLFDR